MNEGSNAGAKQKNWFMRHKIITTILVIFVLGIIGSAMGVDQPDSQRRKADNQIQEKQAPAPELVMTISAAKIVADYEANGVAADQTYKGKLVEVSGQIKDISKDILDTPYIALDSGNILWDVQCMFDKSNADQLVNLSKEENITLVGKVSGKLGNVILRECEIK